MKQFGTMERLLLLLVALLVGGGLGWMLLPDFELGKMCLFLAFCMALGCFFSWFDRRIVQK